MLVAMWMRTVWKTMLKPHVDDVAPVSASAFQVRRRRV